MRGALLFYCSSSLKPVVHYSFDIKHFYVYVQSLDWKWVAVNILHAFRNLTNLLSVSVLKETGGTWERVCTSSSHLSTYQEAICWSCENKQRSGVWTEGHWKTPEKVGLFIIFIIYIYWLIRIRILLLSLCVHTMTFCLLALGKKLFLSLVEHVFMFLYPYSKIGMTRMWPTQCACRIAVPLCPCTHVWLI